MSDFSEVTVCGRMGEPQFFEIGEKKTPKAAFSVAVNKYRPKQGGEGFDQRTIWVPCVAWARVASQIKQNGGKGVTIMASGEFEVEEYQDKEGNPKKSQFVRLRSVKLFDFKSGNSEAASQNTSQNTNNNSGFQPSGPFG